MSYTDDDCEILANRVNDPPTVFRGCTASELVFIAVVSLLVLAPGCIAIGAMFGGWMVGFGASFLLMLGAIFIAATVLQRIKRNRPPGYYQHLIPVALHRAGIKKSGFRLPRGRLSLGRSR